MNGIARLLDGIPGVLVPHRVCCLSKMGGKDKQTSTPLKQTKLFVSKTVELVTSAGLVLHSEASTPVVAKNAPASEPGSTHTSCCTQSEHGGSASSSILSSANAYERRTMKKEFDGPSEVRVVLNLRLVGGCSTVASSLSTM